MAFIDGVYEEDELIVESKVKDCDDFKYTKIQVDRPLKDEQGNPILKKDKPQPDKSLKDMGR